MTTTSGAPGTAPAPPAGSTGEADARVASASSRAVGAALAAGVRVVRLWRDRPLHPRGAVLAGTLRVDDTGAPGAAALGAPATREVLVRVSRAAGLPAPLPDVFGLALHWAEDGRAHDLLLSGTGLGRATRFLLAPRLRPLRGGFGSLMPFRDLDGRPVLLAAVPADSRPVATRGARADAVAGATFVLLSAHPAGAWHRLGVLRCGAPAGRDAPRLDPVLHAPGALRTYPWAAALRRPSYRAARGGSDPGA